jgi:flagellar basal-body rod protein FlgC
MSVDAVYAVSRFGLDYERGRMEAAGRRIALANTPIGPASAAQGTTGKGFAHAVGEGGAVTSMGNARDGSATGVRSVLDPQNPMAGPDGMVHYPDVDMAQEMTTLMSAQRAYQADIRAFNTLHGMMLKALDIGSR